MRSQPFAVKREGFGPQKLGEPLLCGRYERDIDPNESMTQLFETASGLMDCRGDFGVALIKEEVSGHPNAQRQTRAAGRRGVWGWSGSPRDQTR